MHCWVAFRYSSALFRTGEKDSSDRMGLGMMPLSDCISINMIKIINIHIIQYTLFLIMIQKILRQSFCVERQLLAFDSILRVRNSETLQLKIPNMKDKIINVARFGTLADLSREFQNKFQISDIEFYCNLKIKLPEDTCLDQLINRYFQIRSKEFYPMIIQGESFDYGRQVNLIEGIQSIELPAVQKREIQMYSERIDKWYQLKTGRKLEENSKKISSATASQIFVESLIDIVPQERNIAQIEKQWQKIYWQIQYLKDKQREADEVCIKKVKRRLSLGLMMLAGNIGFIWSGTYIFYSWDIIQPLAYFVSSMGTILLATRFFKIGRPFSKRAYQQYLIKKLTPKVYKSLEFDEGLLKKLQLQHLQLQSQIKDYYLRKL